MIETAGLTHLQILISDLERSLRFRLLDRSQLDEAVTAVERAGGRLIHRGEHMPGFPFASVADPDGYVIELLPLTT